jgi:hypothetical protein
VAEAVERLLARRAAAARAVRRTSSEELFTLDDAAARARFAGALRALARDPAVLDPHRAARRLLRRVHGERAVARLRARPLRGHAAARPELRDAIVMPAQTAGVALEDALVERLVADTAAEPGALPLLQATLVELWDVLARRRGDAAGAGAPAESLPAAR